MFSVLSGGVWVRSYRPSLCKRVNRCPQCNFSPSSCVSVRNVSPLTQGVYYLARPSPAGCRVFTALQLFMCAIAVLLHSLHVTIRLHDAHTCQQVLTQWCQDLNNMAACLLDCCPVDCLDNHSTVIGVKYNHGQCSPACHLSHG